MLVYSVAKLRKYKQQATITGSYCNRCATVGQATITGSYCNRCATVGGFLFHQRSVVFSFYKDGGGNIQARGQEIVMCKGPTGHANYSHRASPDAVY